VSDHDVVSDYDADFYAWTREQAAALRTVRPTRVDWEHVAEALDEMGGSELGALESDLARVIEHLLKLQHSPAADPRNGWILTVVEHRARIESACARSGTLLRKLPELLPAAWKRARKLAAKSLELYDGVDPAGLPDKCPYRLDEIRADDWYPAGHGQGAG
jgi:hypothetical protein